MIPVKRIVYVAIKLDPINAIVIKDTVYTKELVKILMNVQKVVIAVTKKLHVKIPKVRTHARATVVSMDQVHYAQKVITVLVTCVVMAGARINFPPYQMVKFHHTHVFLPYKRFV